MRELQWNVPGEKMRWISMVPSWTETLIECGANVVGRTRFCVHPQPQVKSIPAVGGTKDFKIESILELNSDCLLLDREENPKAMAEAADAANLRSHASHIRSISDLPRELSSLAQIAENGGDRKLSESLFSLGKRWEKVVNASKKQRPTHSLQDLPGVIEWLRAPVDPQSALEKTQFVYVIWRKPWMCASEGTFISSVLHAVGVGSTHVHSPQGAANLYPEFEFENLPIGSLILLSSEPYPFGTKKKSVLEELKSQADTGAHAIALVDGESFSWFGLRSLIFLESALLRPSEF